uniref:Uncharacterized protein n=1 Tax=Ditylenchus dipsaci TaxID=166011 RepID=A0A915EGJ3_9BILA
MPGQTHNASYMAAAAAQAAAHHAAQMNAQHQQMMYGTGTLTRGSTGTLNRLPPLQDDIYGWLYTPQAYNVYPSRPGRLASNNVHKK